MHSKSLVFVCITLLLAVLASADTHLRHGNNAVAHDPQGRHVQQSSTKHVDGGAYVAKRQFFLRNVGTMGTSFQKIPTWVRNFGQPFNHGVQKAQRWIGSGQQVMNSVNRGKGRIQKVGGFATRGLLDGQPKDME
ncbi:hypothetical protein H310_02454 [Aphanomyces invadans]|uniref:RxLR effector protein n=1 Tax=Aphanomyces invadans TaxID=157072 RepID=A0A024UQG8_9STRA|nr:hypothetical protein H310_02454 [Aphanomyces invadans]ETW08092.1 hypothetical protein H310_02454 [Aphanomyces invadans]|eukprot:XP_008864185.1 hypothetical protein H310_02454 [Aphanomyces invadans]